MLKKSDHHSSAKAIISFLVVLVAFGVYMILYRNQDTFLSPDRFPLLMTLATVLMGLLIALVYLVSTSSHHPVKTTKSTKSKKRSRK